MTFAKNFDAVWHVKRERSIRCLRASANLALANLRGIESSAEIVGKRVVVSAVLRMASSSRVFVSRKKVQSHAVHLAKVLGRNGCISGYKEVP